MFKSIFAAALVLVATFAQADRIRDLTSVQGVRGNSLIGYGLVVGLDGTGDQTTQTPFTTQSLNNMLSQLGITVPAGTNMQLKNVAAVMVTASYPAFARQGQTIDVVVSSMGNAKSLRGGTLLMTPLKGVDSQVYALAQGNILVGGAGASAGGSSVQVNQLNGGRITNGAIIERELPTQFGAGNTINLQLWQCHGTGCAYRADPHLHRQQQPGAHAGGYPESGSERAGAGCQSDHQLPYGLRGDEPGSVAG
jgi:flagellar P-ring protein precursor FlgI